MKGELYEYKGQMMTQADIAKLEGINRQTLADWYKKTYDMSLAVLGAKKSLAQRNISYYDEVLSLKAISEKEKIKFETLKKYYEQTNDIYEAVRLTKESQLKRNGSNINLTSVMELITVNNFKVFLAADMPKAGTNYLKNVSKIVGKINVLKMPHHGYYECGMSGISANNFNPDYVIVTNTYTKGRTGCEETIPSKIPIYYNKDISRNSIIVDLSGNSVKIIK